MSQEFWEMIATANAATMEQQVANLNQRLRSLPTQKLLKFLYLGS